MKRDELYDPDPHEVALDPKGTAEDAEEVAGVTGKPGREPVEVSRRGATCYRLEKIKCGKKSCRCTRGELHGPYWYACYRENGRMRCEYMRKSLPEHVGMESRPATGGLCKKEVLYAPST